MFESRESADGTHYVVESVSGHLAHVEAEGGWQRAAVGMTAEQAEQTADALNRESR